MYTDDNGYKSWAMSLDDYVKAAVAEVVEDLDRQRLKLKGKHTGHMNPDTGLKWM